jgi:RNA polymerase sigma-70 factor (ECF subfamily)
MLPVSLLGVDKGHSSPMSPAVERSLRVVRSGREEADASAEEARLAEAVRAGDNRAAATFHDRLRPVVERTLLRLLGGRDPDHDDVAQQALVDLVFSMERFRGECPLDAWAAIIAARAAYKHIRRRKIERRLFVLEPLDGYDVVDRAAGGTVAHRSTIRRIEAHLRKLDVRKAWTFVLHDVEGFSLSEVSEITGVSTAAAQTRLVRGRRELHARIGADPELSGLLKRGSRYREEEES